MIRKIHSKTTIKYTLLEDLKWRRFRIQNISKDIGQMGHNASLLGVMVSIRGKKHGGLIT